MKPGFLVIETDAHHTKANRNIKAVCTSFRSAVTLVLNEMHELKLIPVSEFGKFRETLQSHKQTQGFDTNFEIQEVEQNKIIN